jgi:hypothetical protein
MSVSNIELVAALRITPNNAGPPHEAKRNKAGLSDYYLSFIQLDHRHID